MGKLGSRKRGKQKLNKNENKDKTEHDPDNLLLLSYFASQIGLFAFIITELTQMILLKSFHPFLYLPPWSPFFCVCFDDWSWISCLSFKIHFMFQICFNSARGLNMSYLEKGIFSIVLCKTPFFVFVFGHE